MGLTDKFDFDWGRVVLADVLINTAGRAKNYLRKDKSFTSAFTPAEMSQHLNNTFKTSLSGEEMVYLLHELGTLVTSDGKKWDLRDHSFTYACPPELTGTKIDPYQKLRYSLEGENIPGDCIP